MPPSTPYHSAVRLGAYLVHLRVARGGMADVYIATHAPKKRAEPEVVAIKRVRRELSEDATFLRMFLDEARITRYLDHPGIVRILDIGGYADSTYLVMEFVPGLNLKTIVERGPMPPYLAAEVIAAVAEALHAAHEQKDEYGQPLNIVHRDVTPMNVMVTFEGGVKLLDFGIAVARGRAEKTKTGIVKGKWSYLSPEQVLGDKVDRRADIFTMGSLLYEMVTAKRAFTGSIPVKVLRAVATEEPPPPTSFDPDLPAEMVEIISRCLKKRRQERFQDALELSNELEAIAGMWNLVTGSSEQESLSSYLKRHFADRHLSLTSMLDRVVTVAKAASGDTPELDGTPIPAPYEERAGDLVSASDEPPSMGDAESSSVPGVVPGDVSAEATPSGEEFDEGEYDEEEYDDEEERGLRWPLLAAILFGVLIGGVLAVVVWFLNFGGL